MAKARPRIRDREARKARRLVEKQKERHRLLLSFITLTPLKQQQQKQQQQVMQPNTTTQEPQPRKSPVTPPSVTMKRTKKRPRTPPSASSLSPTLSQQSLITRTISDTTVPSSSSPEEEKEEGVIREPALEAEKLTGEWVVINFNCQCGKNSKFLLNGTDNTCFKMLGVKSWSMP